MDKLPADLVKLILSLAKGSLANMVCKRWRKLLGPQIYFRSVVTSKKLLLYAFSIGMPREDKVAHAIMTKGKIKLIKLAYSYSVPLTEKCCYAAVVRNDSNLLFWMIERMKDPDFHEIVVAAAIFGRMDILQKLDYTKSDLLTATQRGATIGEQTQLLDHLYQTGKLTDSYACIALAVNLKKKKSIEWFEEKGFRVYKVYATINRGYLPLS